jgi:hypothetical protein
VRVLAHGCAVGHRLDHGRAEVLRVRAREADALDAVDVVARAQQLAELGADLRQQVAAPGVDVLAEQRHLAHAPAGELRHLGENVTGPAAHLAPAHGRHDAVRALRVAAHGDLHPGLEAPLAVQRQRRRERALAGRSPRSAPYARAAGAEPFAEMRDRARPERDVDCRVEREEPLALRLGVAAADRDHELGALALARGRIAHVRRELRVGLLSDRAGVEDDDVRLRLRRRLAQAELLEHALDPLAVVRVHLTAERGDVVRRCQMKVPVHLGGW